MDIYEFAAQVLQETVNTVTKEKFTEASSTAIKKFEIGYPCMFGEAVCRIVGESGKGSWGKINGQNFYSMPNVATPHGSIITVGVLRLKEMTEEGAEKMRKYEEELIAKGVKPYDGLLEGIIDFKVSIK